MENQGPSTVHYEVYALNGQRWTLHARFRRDEKTDALEEAKDLENRLGMCAKVVREIYYPDNNTSEESLVYASDKNFRPRQRAPLGRSSGHARPDAVGAAGLRPVTKAAAAGKSMGMLLKLFLVVGASMAIASGATVVVNAFMGEFPMAGSRLHDSSASLVVFGTFVAAFLASAIPLALKFLEYRPAGNQRESTAAPIPANAAATVREPPKPVATAAETAAAPTGEAAPAPTQEGEEAKPSAGEEPPAGENDQASAPADQAEKTEETPKEAVSAENLRLTMVRFLSALLGEVKKVHPALDAYNIFGVDLMLAGAVDVLGSHKALDAGQKRSILKDTIEVMGTRGETAQTFADKYEDYLTQPKYLSMVQVGRNAMESMLAGAETEISGEALAQAFEGWNRPQQATQTAARIITVLFTDMVGSTDLTQARGDHAAQDIVRRHNSIVRSALAEFAGKEIKHTGDGIMASFASTANAVEAAISIQRACAMHNERYPDQPLRLRIGLNAGEPIEEEDDLFGTTVQLSARVCAQSATDEILCTNVVRELSAGKGIVFTASGTHELKGFKDPIALFSVDWRLPAEEEEIAQSPASADLAPTPAAAPTTPAPSKAKSHQAGAKSAAGKSSTGKGTAGKQAIRAEKPATQPEKKVS